MNFKPANDECRYHGAKLKVFAPLGRGPFKIISVLEAEKEYVDIFHTSTIKCNDSNFKKYFLSCKHRSDSANLAAIKIFYFLTYYGFLPKRHVLDIGAAPGYVTKCFSQVGIPVWVMSLEEGEMRNHLQPAQLEHYRDVCRSELVSVVPGSGNVFCLDCLKSAKDASAEAAAAFIVCDVGWPSESEHLDSFAPLRNILDVFEDSIDLLFCKVQKFFNKLDYRIINRLLSLPYAVYFLKPAGSWLGNNEAYVLITGRLIKSNRATISNLVELFAQVAEYRKLLSIEYDRVMGIKNIFRLFSGHFSDRMKSVSGELAVNVDVSCLVHVVGYGVIDYIPFMLEDKVDNEFVSDGLRIDLVLLANSMLKKICSPFSDRTKLRVKMIFDGVNRPLMKAGENAKRTKTANDRQSFIRQMLKDASEDIKKALTDSQVNHPKVIELSFVHASGEADCLVCKDADVTITNDSDIGLMACLQPNNPAHIIFCGFSNTVRVFDVEGAKRDLNIRALILFTIIVGNDYLPSLYSPTNPKELYGKLSFVHTCKEVFELLQKTRCQFKSIAQTSDCRMHLSDWLEKVHRFVLYLESGDPAHLNYISPSSPLAIKNYSLQTILSVYDDVAKQFDCSFI